jgi:hypothetical protein
MRTPYPEHAAEDCVEVTGTPLSMMGPSESAAASDDGTYSKLPPKSPNSSMRTRRTRLAAVTASTRVTPFMSRRAPLTKLEAELILTSPTVPLVTMERARVDVHADICAPMRVCDQSEHVSATRRDE